MLNSIEIRLFELLAGAPSTDPHEAVEGRTIVVPMETHLKYESVSYVSGNQKETTQVFVDGQAVAITNNLHAILGHIRCSDTSRFLCIDQLCIDQANNEEKATQVPLMGQIYSNAKQCLIWLGDIPKNITKEDAAAALDMLRLLSGQEKSDVGSAIKGLRWIGSEDNAWWHRIWTLQEAVLSREATFCWGGLTIAWDTIAGAATTETCPEELLDIFNQNLDTFNAIFTQVIGLEWAEAGDEDALDMAFRWGWRHAHNPLDLVYGLLGLFPPGSLPRSERVNYGLSPGKLFASFTIDLIAHSRSLQPIALMDRSKLMSDAVPTPGIPSWAFDMANAGIALEAEMESKHGGSLAWFLEKDYDWYDACGGEEIDWQHVRFSEDSNELTLNGTCVGIITVAGAPLMPEHHHSTQVGGNGQKQHVLENQQRESSIQVPDLAVRQHIQAWKQQIPNPQQLEAFWRGLTCDIVCDSEMSPLRRMTTSGLKSVEGFVEIGTEASLCHSMSTTMGHRTFMLTDTNLIGFGPGYFLAGDQVWILRGCKVPVILRSATAFGGTTARFCMIGPAYIDGIMHGENTLEEAIQVVLV